jgi:hypothetical protein
MEIPDLERSLNYCKQELPLTGELASARINIVKAQNILQKYIENNYDKKYWKHLKIVATINSISTEPEIEENYDEES